MSDMLTSMAKEQNVNDLKSFKEYLESDKSNINDYVSDIRYKYNLVLNLYKSNFEEKIVQVNPSTVFENLGIGNSSENGFPMMSMMSETNSWTELTDNEKQMKSQYDLVYGKYPTNYDEVVLVMDKNNEVSDYALYSLGLLDQSELKNSVQKIMSGEKIEKKDTISYKYDEIVGLEYKLLLNTDYYEKQGNIWVNKKTDEEYMKNLLANAVNIKVVGIVKINEDSSSTTTGVIGYTKALTEYTINKINESEITKEQKNNPNINVFTGLEFSSTDFSMNNLPIEQQQYLASLSKEELAKIVATYTENSSATYDSNLLKLGIFDLSDPSSIELYPKDFESKDEIVNVINKYNETKSKDNKLVYNDIVGVMMKSVTTIINAISYILMAFVSISLIVSSIMIAIITYISVIERTKEIGILRAIGASKKDVSRVFNAETLIEGLFAGILGIIVTLIINIPINIIIKNITSIKSLSKLPVGGAIVLVIISVLLTLIAGLIPSKMASKKEPVEALRSE